jgi:hypothetical protein
MSASPPKADKRADVSLSPLCTNGGLHAVQQKNHSITSSARSCIELGTMDPSIFAALKLMTNSNVVGRMTGRCRRTPTHDANALASKAPPAPKTSAAATH